MMALREKEEEDNYSSNTKMPQFNTQESKKEGDINLQIGTSNSQNHCSKVPIDDESERSRKRPRITKSDEAESTTNNNKKESHISFGLGQDPLLVAEKILLQYCHFVDYLYQNLKNDDEKQDLKVQWQKWREILTRGIMLVKTLYRDLRIFTLAMKYVERSEGVEKRQDDLKKTQILSILNLFGDINSRIASSSYLRVVSNMKKREKVMGMCLRELERWRQELRQLIGLMKVLKEMDLNSR